MVYRLVVLTHGRYAPLSYCLDSFAKNVTPAPADAYVHVDGRDGLDAAYGLLTARKDWTWTLGGSDDQRGFCESTRDCMLEAATGDHDYVFYLEHDFVFSRPVNLLALAGVLDVEPQLAQMVLKRQPVNAEEIAAGGYVPLRGPDYYQARETLSHPWLEHRGYWSTNPSLFRREVAENHPWPTMKNCEGHYGFQLRDQRPGTTFGVWGSAADPPLVRHIGERTGFGY